MSKEVSLRQWQEEYSKGTFDATEGVVKDMELKKNWADKVIEKAEEMSGVERSTYAQKKMEELVDRIS